ncbi:hypothetical protein BDA99DRAFT_200145 [Phascolomyces articulosus]|uniref:Uncharacterized protein n=1 Tax=Phascolomyces articulosus TaxID=60185 RepID=A0AAD5KAD1_9FUNG|nr:hypothetical protein BDA99DRAFT_200145 [Phascolomyces articulosus]
MDNVEPETDNDVRSFMRQKYYEHKWLDRDALQAQTERIRTIVSEMFTDEGFRRRGVKTPPLPSSTTNGGVAAPTPLPKPTRPASLQLTRSAWKPEISSPTTSSSSSVDPSSPLTLREPMSAREPSGSSPVSSGGFALPPSSPVPVTPTNMDQYTPRRTSQPPLPQYHQQQQEQQSPQQQKQQPPLPLSSQPSSPLPQHHQQQQTPRQPITPTSSIFSELAGLQPESTKSARRATYTGGILTPSTPNATSPTSLQFPSLFQITTPTTSTTLLNNNNNNTTTTTTTTSSTQQQASNDPFKIFQQQQQKASENTKPEDDPYAALRGLKISSPPEPPKPQQPSPQAQTQPDIPNFHERQDSDEMSWTGENF